VEDLEGGVGEFWGTKVCQWFPGANPRQGAWGTESPRSWSIFQKCAQPEFLGQVKMKGIIWCHRWRFFIAVHTSIVLFQCHVAQNVWHLGGMSPCTPKSALRERL